MIEINNIPKIIPVPKNLAEVKKTFGIIEAVSIKGGNVRITNGWAKDNMVKVELPIVGKKWVHVLLQDIFYQVLEYIEYDNYNNEIKTFGTWCPRFKRHDPNAGLSYHSWGICCDINQKENPMGKRGELSKNSKIVQTFELFGFTWGGRWNGKSIDPMHFQYCK